jgi:hypothetical protein
MKREEVISLLDEKLVEHKFSLFNGFSAELTKKEIDSLEKMDFVERIEYDEIVKPLLGVTTETVGAKQTWDLQVRGINLTGGSQSVCVIDSGIYYYHNDLGGCFGEGCKIIAGYDVTENKEDIINYENAHGTYVSGVIASSGGATGVASGANIVGLKVMDVDGVMYRSKIYQAIEWCTTNSELYNISVISMSLGSTNSYNDYCDSSHPTYFNLVNNANFKNISVVAATGNEYKHDEIIAPACLSNVIAVGAIWHEDGRFTTYSNRWGLDMVTAPGSANSLPCIPGISSKCVDNSSHWFASGTSIATPFVSGAIALINQYLKLTEKNLTPKEIEILLYNTGNILWDETNQRNYSIINVFDAIMKLDIPIANLISPGNNLFTNENSNLFSANFSDFSLKNTTLNIWDANTSQLIFQETIAISNTFNISQINYTFEQDGIYLWNYFVCDIDENCVWAGNNFTITIDTTPPELEFKENTTSSGNHSQGSIFISIGLLEENFNNITFKLFNSTSFLKEKTYSNLTLSTVFTNLKNDIYKIEVVVFDKAGHYNSIERDGIHLTGLKGDVNSDGNVDISDVILTLRLAIGLDVLISNISYFPPYPLFLINLADVNYDGNVDISDVILILRIAIGLDEQEAEEMAYKMMKSLESPKTNFD